MHLCFVHDVNTMITLFDTFYCVYNVVFIVRQFHTVLLATAGAAIARFSHRNSVRLSVTRVDQSKTVQARITKFSPSAARKTLVSGTVKLFHKFEGSRSERGH